MTYWEKFKKLLPSIPDSLSFLRGMIGILLPFMVLSPSKFFHIVALPLFLIATVTDYLDGWLARKEGKVTSFGKILDPTMDKILVLAPFLAFAERGMVPVWWLVPLFARELFVTFCRIGWLLEGRAAGAEKLGKIKFGVQILALAPPFFLLLARDFQWEYLSGLFSSLILPVLILAVILTLVSGASFLYVNRQNFLTPFFAKFVSAAGVGLIPITPGTLGSLLAIPLIVLTAWNPWLYAGTFVSIFAAGYWAVGRLDLSLQKDPSFVVVDEVLGMFVTLMLIPLSWKTILVGFLLFRVFDIVKPFPVRDLEKLPGYWGILLDDLGAGFYGWLIMVMIFR